MSVAEDHPCRGDVERQTKEGDDEQNRRKSGQIGRFGNVERNKQNQHGKSDDDRQHEVEHRTGQRYDDDRQNRHDEKDDAQIA